MAWLLCLHINHKDGTALVKSRRTQRSFPVTLGKRVRFLASKGDLLDVLKSPVSGEWIAVDYNAMFAMTAGDEE